MPEGYLPAYLVLEDGSVHPGEGFGADVEGHGEVVFNTSMTGYQEVLTDPSYAGQMVTLTYPLVGNYGINEEDYESRCIQVSGLIVREHCDLPSHGLSRWTLHEFLASQGIPGISGVDTRAITRRLRSRGVMMGLITRGEPETALRRLSEMTRYDDVDFVSAVTTAQSYRWDDHSPESGEPRKSGPSHSPAVGLSSVRGEPFSQAQDRPLRQAQDRLVEPLGRWTDGPSTGSGRTDFENALPRKYRILVTDCGLKYNILRLLQRRGCEVIVLPAATPAEDMLALDPSGILLSPGPGDPQLLDYLVSNVTGLLGRVPIMGICLGHQIVARALGADTYKLKFGHRGGNHPVKDLSTGRVYITAQNHGYAVSTASLPSRLEVSHVSLNDDTIEGLRHKELPLFSIQYHSEAAPGPRDNEYLFDRFLKMIEDFADGG